ncbi:ABC transporter substrate-binding protein [Lentisphaerota bacterium WC36G]|nr:ABC transporter substrate-binding protein [Lentisphaerae bacterium WC36]
MKKKWKKKIIYSAFLILLIIGIIAIFTKNNPKNEKTDNILNISMGAGVKSLDPAFASDFVSQYMVGNFYDTLLQYSYKKRPYQLEPSMLVEMPKVNSLLTEYSFRLRDDLYFSKNKCFEKNATKEQRKVTAKDVKYTILRIADSRSYSPVYWMFRGQVKGLNEFRELSKTVAKDDFSIYENNLAGFEIINDREFKIILTAPNPRFLYMFALPNSGIVSRKAVRFYSNNLNETVVGSGAFLLGSWRRNYVMNLVRNDEYRTEYFVDADNTVDRTKKLPLVDKVKCMMVKQPLSSWLLFLQGNLDLSNLAKDSLDAVISEDGRLINSFKKRGIVMSRNPQFEVQYIGFNFRDPVLGKNLNLRKAISLAFNKDLRIRYLNGQALKAQSPIPPGVAGYNENSIGDYGDYDLEKAKKYMELAGYKGGIDPQTNQPLKLTFDQSGSSTVHRQLGELMQNDMKEIGIDLEIGLNNRARFFQKVRSGNIQLFRLSWIGDYPDAENFLQLFYGGNVNGCNRVAFNDDIYNQMYDEIKNLPNSEKRTKLYCKMVDYLQKQCPWIFESYPITFRLTHSWVRNYIPHDFAFSRWKYLAIDSKKRQEMKKNFKPLSMNELRK